MVLSLPSPSPAVGLFLAQQLEILRVGTDVSQIGVNISRDLDLTTSQGDIPATVDYPRGHWVQAEGKTWIFIGGCHNVQHAIRYVNFMSGPFSYLETGINGGEYVTRALDNYLLPVTADAVNRSGTLQVAGHSLGGALGQVVMDAGRARGIRTAHNCVTFGSPKIVKRPNQTHYDGLHITRWMNNDDPIPNVPPAVVTNINALTILSPQTLQEWSRSLQLAGGVSVNSDGTTEDIATAPMGHVNFAASLANWLWNIYQQRLTVHDLPEYVRRLELVVVRTTPPAVARVIESGPEPNATLSRRDANRQIQAGIDSIIRVAAAQNAAQLGVPPERAFNPFKIGPIWFVEFGGVIVAVGPRRKAVGLMCTNGNKFLRRLQRMGGVDGNGLARMLALYIDAASAPDQGFTPPIARLD